MESKPYKVCSKHKEAYPEWGKCLGCMQEEDAKDLGCSFWLTQEIGYFFIRYEDRLAYHKTIDGGGHWGDRMFVEGIMDLVAEKQWDERVDFCERHREYYMYDQECGSCLQEEDAAYGSYGDDLVIDGVDSYGSIE